MFNHLFLENLYVLWDVGEKMLHSNCLRDEADLIRNWCYLCACKILSIVSCDLDEKTVCTQTNGLVFLK